MAMLKMVNGKTYIDPRVNGGEMVKLGDEIDVGDARLAEDLLSLKFIDRKDNERSYFKRVKAPVVDAADELDDEEGDESGEEAGEAGAKTEAKTAAPRRTRKAA